MNKLLPYYIITLVLQCVQTTETWDNRCNNMDIVASINVILMNKSVKYNYICGVCLVDKCDC